jgi:hypothetical protein
MNRYVAGFAAFLVLAAAVWWAIREPAPIGEAYGGERMSTLWSRVAQVREPLGTVRYGDRVWLLERRGEHVRARNAEGDTGWIEERRLIPGDTWQRSVELRQKAQALAPQARGVTKVATNVRLEPGRTGTRIFQFEPQVRVEILARQVAEWKPAAPAAPREESQAPRSDEEEPAPVVRKEDWLLVRARAEGPEVAGWVRGSFVAPEYPAPLRDYAAGIRFLAWFELSYTMDVEGPKPTYLAAGVVGGEGQPCDFTLVRVYNWSTARRRYETAYVESFLCGRLPISVSPATRPGVPAAFRFLHTGRRGTELREYRMKQNVVQRVRSQGR